MTETTAGISIERLKQEVGNFENDESITALKKHKHANDTTKRDRMKLVGAPWVFEVCAQAFFPTKKLPVSSYLRSEYSIDVN